MCLSGIGVEEKIIRYVRSASVSRTKYFDSPVVKAVTIGGGIVAFVVSLVTYIKSYPEDLKEYENKIARWNEKLNELKSLTYSEENYKIIKNQ